jgi:WD40 repeat protein
MLRAALNCQGEVWDVEFSPDGKFLATTGMTPTPVIWDATSGELLMKLVGHKSFVAKVEFSLDGETLITEAMTGRSGSGT